MAPPTEEELVDDGDIVMKQWKQSIYKNERSHDQQKQMLLDKGISSELNLPSIRTYIDKAKDKMDT